MFLYVKCIINLGVYLFLQLNVFEIFGQDRKRVELVGKIDTAYNGPIYLRYEISPNSPLSYEAKVVDGSFSFNIDLIEPVAAVLSIPQPSTTEYMYLDTSAMVVTAHIASFVVGDEVVKSFKILGVQGSRSQTIHKHLMERTKVIYESGIPVKVQADYLFATLDSLVKLYPDHSIISQALSFAEILSYSQALTVYYQLSLRQQNHSTYNGIGRLLARLKRTDLGEEVALKDLKNELGQPITVERNRYQMLLLDFWASWCAPCRAKYPELKSLYEEYNAKGFGIIGISLDTDRNKWLKAIKDDNIPWLNASDLKGYSGYLPFYYTLDYVPFNLLLDGHFKIIGKNVSSNDLKIFLQRRFDAKSATLLPDQ